MCCNRNCCILIAIGAVGILLAWLFNYFPWMWWARGLSKVPPVSYDGRITFNLENLKVPTTEQEIVDIVSNAYEQGSKIRVLADGHSWSEIAQTEDIMISLSNYTGLVGKPENLMATFRAGTALSKISEILEGEGLSMINLGSVAGQSIAGAISTGTHGTGLTIGNLAEFVTKLKFVSGTGQVVTVSENDPDTDLFKAAQVSIGMLGVLTEVTVRVEPLFYLEENRTSSFTLDECLENLDSFVKGALYVKMWIDFYHDYCILYQTSKTNSTEITILPWYQAPLTYYTFAVSTRVTYLLPFLTSFSMYLVDHVGFCCDTHRVDVSYRIFNDYFDLPIHQEGEVVVDYKYAAATVRTIREVVLSNSIPVNYITEVRFVKGDDIWLSPEYDTNPGTCAITLTIYAPNDRALNYFNKVYEATVDKYNARIHWGKHFTAGPSQIAKWYPKYPQFLAKRKEMDPKGIFLNEFLTDTFISQK